MLQRLQDRGVRVRLRLKMEARTEAEALSANVVGEIRGRERPEEMVVVGCHLDSWDVGTGASDDGAGCVVTWEALRLIKSLGLKPRRTVRLVLWTNEENGLRGGVAYLARHRATLSQHVMMLEADMGVFSPISFGFTGSERARAKVQAIASLLTKVGADRVGPSGGGADIGPSVQAGNIPSMALSGDPVRYFQIHHTRGRHHRPHRSDGTLPRLRRHRRNDLHHRRHARTPRRRDAGNAIMITLTGPHASGCLLRRSREPHT